MSLEIGAEMLQLFRSDVRTLGGSEMAERLKVSRPTAHRYAATLVKLGYLQQDAARKYALTARAANPGISVIKAMRQELPVSVVLQELRDEIGYTVSLGALAAKHVIYIQRYSGHRRGQYEIDRELRAGAHVPLYCTAIGKALLLGLSESWRHRLISEIDFIPQGPRSISSHRELLSGLARMDPGLPVVSDEEFIAGARAIAMQVARPEGSTPVAVEVNIPSTDYTITRLRGEIGPQLRYAAKLISECRKKE